MTSGLVVDSGYDHTEVAPVFEGSCIDEAFVKSPLGGLDISLYLQKIIKEKKLA